MIEQDVHFHLKNEVSGVSGRVYPLRLPQKCVKPAIVYFVVSNVENANMSGWCDSSNPKSRMQISIFAEHYSEQKEIEIEVKEALRAFKNKVKEITNRDLFEEQTELYHGLIEFKI